MKSTLVRQAACPPLRPGLQRACQSTPRSGPLNSGVRRPFGLRCKRFPKMGAVDPGEIGAGRLSGRRPSRAPPEHVIGTLRRSRRLLVSRLWGAVWRWCAGDLGCRRYDANDAPSPAFDIVLGDHRHAGPVAVTPRASSAQLAGTPLRGLPPAIFAGTRRAGARPRVPLLTPSPRRRVVHRARRPTIVRRPPPSPLAGPLHAAAAPLASASAAGEDSWCEHGARRGGWWWRFVRGAGRAADSSLRKCVSARGQVPEWIEMAIRRAGEHRHMESKRLRPEN